MELEHEFSVPVGVKEAWDVLLDVERIAPCMPGAKVLDVNGDEFTGTVKVKVGPISMTYAGDARFAEKDEAARRVVIEAAGKESRGSGTAKATVTATLSEGADGSSTDVKVLTDLTVTGRPAQFGRGMLQDVGGRLIGQFADNLAAELQSGEGQTHTGSGAATDGAAASSGSSASAESGTQGQSAAAAQSRPAQAGPAGSAEALDLLEVTGVSAVLTKYRAPIIGGAAGAALLLFILLRRKRRGSH